MKLTLLLASATVATAFVARPPPRVVAPRVRRSTANSQLSMKLMVNAIKYTNGMQDPKIKCPDHDGVPADFTITQEQIETLKRDGVVHIPAALSAEWLAYLRAATEWQINNPHIWASPGVASGIYDYIQRSIWTTNDAFANFEYYSPMATILAKLGETEEIRLSTDLLMVNPNSGFKWHQDNQNGPVLFDDALRWWVTMDDTPAEYGAPVYLKGSHKNKSVKSDAVFVDIESGDLVDYPEQLEFRPKAGDMIVWDARSIHKIDGPESKDWGVMKRRVLGGTGVKKGAVYMGEDRALFSDMSTHELGDGDILSGPQWPRLYPSAVPSEMQARANGECSRTMEGFLRMSGNMLASIGEMASWTNVLKKNKAVVEDEKPAEADDRQPVNQQ
uniref:Phytanoyl-CoA dioxygenase n=1 Tax=Florenciella parvula TaxID=236787 RepID=A0A7S2B6C9_9STRA